MIPATLRHYIALLAAAFFAGCEKPAPPPVSDTAVRYDVSGVLESVEPSRGTAVIAHEEIPDYMVAMTMEFTAADPAELHGLVPGDVLAFSLRVTDRESKIDRIRKVGHTTPPVAAPALNVPAIGAQMPDVTLIDDGGRPFHLPEWKGHTIAITFIFTRCPLPDFCPRMNTHFAAAVKGSSGKDFRFLSVTIDPEHDTPPVLSNYARSFRVDPENWKFATGEPAALKRLTAFAGLETKGDGAGLTHNLRTLVVSPSGCIARVFSGNEWQPAELLAAMKAARL